MPSPSVIVIWVFLWLNVYKTKVGTQALTGTNIARSCWALLCTGMGGVRSWQSDEDSRNVRKTCAMGHPSLLFGEWSPGISILNRFFEPQLLDLKTISHTIIKQQLFLRFDFHFQHIALSKASTSTSSSPGFKHGCSPNAPIW